MSLRITKPFRFLRLVIRIKAVEWKADVNGHMGLSWNMYDRMSRVCGTRTYGLRFYQKQKQTMVNLLGHEGAWKFDSYTLS